MSLYWYPNPPTKSDAPGWAGGDPRFLGETRGIPHGMGDAEKMPLAHTVEGWTYDHMGGAAPCSPSHRRGRDTRPR